MSTSRLGVQGAKYFSWCRDTLLQVPSRSGRLCTWRGTLGGRHMLCSDLDLNSSHLLSSHLGPALLGVLGILEQQLECGFYLHMLPSPSGEAIRAKHKQIMQDSGTECLARGSEMKCYRSGVGRRGGMK